MKPLLTTRGDILRIIIEHSGDTLGIFWGYYDDIILVGTFYEHLFNIPCLFFITTITVIIFKNKRDPLGPSPNGTKKPQHAFYLLEGTQPLEGRQLCQNTISYNIFIFLPSRNKKTVFSSRKRAVYCCLLYFLFIDT